MNTQMMLDRVRVASPCHARWEEMQGGERARFCGQCNKHVFNLSAMTRVEIQTLIHEKEGRFCGRFYRRPDGRMLTADCPTGLRRKRDRLARLAGAMFALLFSFLGGCTWRRAIMGDICIPPGAQQSETNSAPMLGKIYIPMHSPQTNSPAPSGK